MCFFFVKNIQHLVEGVEEEDIHKTRNELKLE